MASANGAPVDTCASVGTFTADGTCTVPAGGTIGFTISGGSGGDGGVGGFGGNGGTAASIDDDGATGGVGGAGGVGGLGAPGATIIGTYTNSTESDVTLEITVGSDGTAGADGNFGLDGLDGVFPFAPATDGELGGDGGFGNAGDPSVIAIFTSPIDEPALLVLAGGGEGGTGGDLGAADRR